MRSAHASVNPPVHIWSMPESGVASMYMAVNCMSDEGLPPLKIDCHVPFRGPNHALMVVIHISSRRFGWHTATAFDISVMRVH